MTVLVSPLAAGDVLDPNQGGTGTDLKGTVAGLTLLTTGNPGTPLALAAPGAVLPVTTQPSWDTSNLAASDAFVYAAIQRSMGTVPLAGITGGVYNFASRGVGALVVFVASGGVISAINAFPIPGAGYAVGDMLVLNTGNYDNVICVTSIGGGGSITGTTVLYGGTGNPIAGGTRPLAVAFSTVAFKYTLAGVLASNATFIMPNGSLITASNQWVIANNTTGAFTVTFFVSDGAGGTQGPGVAIARGVANSHNAFIETDGSTGMWLAAAPN